MLEPPTSKVAVVIDTDAANEIDDQFALALALLSPDQIDLKAVIAEPFSFAHHQAPLLAAQRTRDGGAASSWGTPTRASVAPDALLEDYEAWLDRLEAAGTPLADLAFTTPSEGVDLSVAEIRRVFAAAGIDSAGMVFRGADQYMEEAAAPVQSAGVERLVELARNSDEILYVAAIGCLTNVASALLLAPDIAAKIVVVWTAGYPSADQRSNTPALNLVQDVHATRVVLESEVPLVYMPGFTIGEQLTISQPEVRASVEGRGPLGDLLADLYNNNPLHQMLGIASSSGGSWVIWDLICIAWLIDPNLVPTVIRPAPELATDLRWDLTNSLTRHVMREAVSVDRDGVFRDLFAKLAG